MRKQNDDEEWEEEERSPNPKVVLVFSGFLLVVILFAFVQALMNLSQHPDLIAFVSTGVLVLLGIFGMKSVLRALNELAHERIEDEE